MEVVDVVLSVALKEFSEAQYLDGTEESKIEGLKQKGRGRDQIKSLQEIRTYQVQCADCEICLCPVYVGVAAQHALEITCDNVTLNNVWQLASRYGGRYLLVYSEYAQRLRSVLVIRLEVDHQQTI